MTSPFSVSLLIVGLVLCPLFVGIEPIGGDPDMMYRPIKFELARHLRQGTLPYWSDYFGLGTPLGLAWGAAIAWVQLGLTWELTWLTGFSRPAELLSNYSFPLTHWAQWALPGLYLGRRHQGDGALLGGVRNEFGGSLCLRWHYSIDS